MIESFKQASSGQEKLWKVFWLWGFIGLFAVGVVTVLLMILTEMISLGSVARILISLIILVYFLWVVFAVWRCAFNVNWKIWGYLVRVYIVLQIVLMGVGIWKGVNLELQRPVSGYAVPEQSKSVDVQPTAPSMAAQSQDTSAEPSVSYTKCKEKMEAHALSNNVDPQAYVAQNIGWLNDCVRRAENQ
ncbi:MAG: hypothetical protein J0M34_01895 [Alphaproteobacteria bacterium]|nr:hypothetical protein [Alphaproteobacteria bacterium]